MAARHISLNVNSDSRAGTAELVLMTVAHIEAVDPGAVAGVLKQRTHVLPQHSHASHAVGGAAGLPPPHLHAFPLTAPV